MFNTVTYGNYTPHRDTKNDAKIPSGDERYATEQRCIRTTLAVIPLLSSIKPVGYALGFVMNTARIHKYANNAYNAGGDKDKSIQSLHTAASVAALVGSVFYHPMGMIVTTLHDTAIESEVLCSKYHEGNTLAIASSAAKIFNNCLYLAVLTQGGIGLTLGSLSVQVVTGLFQTVDEYSNGNWIEAAGSLALSGLRVSECKYQFEVLRFFQKMKVETTLKADGKNTTDQVLFSMIEKLKKTLSNEELIYFTGKANAGKIVSPETIWMFAESREKKKSFSFDEINRLIQTIGKYNPNWLEVSKNDLFWQGLYQRAFGNEMIFSKRDWKENYQIFYDTFNLNNAFKNAGAFLSEKGFTSLINRYPNTSEIHLQGTFKITDGPIIQALDTCKNTLKKLTIVSCGLNKEIGEYQAVSQNTINAILECKYLKDLHIMLESSMNSWKVRKSIKSSCKYLKVFEMYVHKKA